MDYSVLETSTLFKGISTKEIKKILEEAPHHIEGYDKGETIFHLMDDADRIGIVLKGSVEAQKPFPNGSQINVSVRGAGEMILPQLFLIAINIHVTLFPWSLLRSLFFEKKMLWY